MTHERIGIMLVTVLSLAFYTWFATHGTVHIAIAVAAAYGFGIATSDIVRKEWGP